MKVFGVGSAFEETMHTACFFDRLPPGCIKISIARSAPRSMLGLPRIAELAPGPWFKTADPETYRSLYVAQLAQLDPARIVERIDVLAQGQTPVLCCWERLGLGDWCHRAWLSVWFAHTLGLVVTELHDPEGGYGASHALLPAEYRRPVYCETPPAQMPLL